MLAAAGLTLIPDWVPESRPPETVIDWMPAVLSVAV